MSVRVIMPSMFQFTTGGITMIELTNCETIGDCFKELRAQYPMLGRMLFDEGDNIASLLNVFVNGRCLNLDSDIFIYPVKNGDEIYPIMMIDGG